MSFTDDERRRWHEQKKRQDLGLEPFWDDDDTDCEAEDTEWEDEDAEGHDSEASHGVCLHCGNPFTEGVVTSEAAICDICIGD